MSASSNPSPQSPPLCTADDATFWPWMTWPQFESWPDRENTVVVVPVAGCGDWGLGHSLDAEEMVLMPVLRDACIQVAAGKKPLVLPPLRFVFGAGPTCAFAVDQDTAHSLIAEVAASIASAGFRRIALVNASPWNEELCGAAARDLRVGKGLQMFQVHLSALELDFHPVRSRSRRRIQTLLTSLLGCEPEPAEFADAEPVTHNWGDEHVSPLAGAAVPLAQARIEGASIQAAAAARLAKLLSDIHDHAPLAARITPV